MTSFCFSILIAGLPDLAASSILIVNIFIPALGLNPYSLARFMISNKVDRENLVTFIKSEIFHPFDIMVNAEMRVTRQSFNF